MAQNTNPFTGREVDPGNIVATPKGHIVFDDEDGCLWGDFALDPNVDADALFLNLFHKERPTKYREYLATLRDAAPTVEGDPAPTVEAATAGQVLDDDNPAQVVVTRYRHMDYVKAFGLPPDSRATDGDGTNPPRNITTLNPGSNGKVGGEESYDPTKTSDTPDTAAARAKANAATSAPVSDAGANG